MPLTLTLSPLAGRGDVPCERLWGTERSRHGPFAPFTGRRWRQPDEGPPRRKRRDVVSSRTGGTRPPQFADNLALHSASSSALCRGSATYQPAVDARDKPEHDERGVGETARSLVRAPLPISVIPFLWKSPWKGMTEERWGETQQAALARTW
ncbi:hypothetical protein E0H68_37375 [Rhizobium leguminosarum bv. viciae]|nr:hypothetical protein E0H44_37525 [Rhizobium leguminosarum bv. viciae]TCA00841.1 hypothetical protein E0H68_37375 [Rhizobium leguminosarum bv. viciae]TCA23920.1 hypothetical protein E0H67_10010 [Rhizobium leguminosarum bv. viciae]